MQSLTPDRLQGRLQAFGRRISEQPHLCAVRDGVVGALPLVLIGSLFLLLAQPPSAALQAWVAPWSAKLLLPYRMLGGLISLYVCFGTARSLAKHRGLDELGVPLVAVASFLVALEPAALAGGGWGVAAERLGSSGLFGALAIALVSVEVQGLVARRGFAIRLPAAAPEAIANSFAAIVPGFVSVGAAWALAHGLGLDPVALLGTALQPLVSVSDSWAGIIAICLTDSLLWLLGVHPMAVLAPIKPLWLAMLTENMEAAAAGLALPHVATREFFLWFVWQGGSGGTLAVALLLSRARSATLRGVGRLGLVPAFFNINEPILFGMPVVMNGRIAAPFVLAPLATASITFVAMGAGWVSAPHLDVLWTLPAPIGAFLATGGDPGAVILQMLNLLVAGGIWWPFLRAYDRALVAAEAAHLDDLPAGGCEAEPEPIQGGQTSAL